MESCENQQNAKISVPPNVGQPVQSGYQSGYNVQRAVDIQNVAVVIGSRPPQKSLFEAYLLCFPLGFLGLHHFYLRRYGFGFLYLFTLGLCGVGWIVDFFRLPRLVIAANRRIENPEEDEELTLLDAYILWFPLGILGLHHYYLRRPAWGLAYTFSLGLFGIGWLIDACRLPTLVKDANGRRTLERANRSPPVVSLCDAYALGLTPIGIFGAHHFYLRRPAFGVYYIFTLGGCGVGWIVDWFRMKWLVDRVNNPYQHVLGNRHKYLDDAYVLAFPLGIFGAHHFYLGRYVWGVLYLFTFGLFGIGWLVDLSRMPCLVRETNRRLKEETRVKTEIREQLGGSTAVCRRQEFVICPSLDPNNASQGAATRPPADSYDPPSDDPISHPPPYGGFAQSGYAAPYGAINSGNPPPYDNLGYEKRETV